MLDAPEAGWAEGDGDKDEIAAFVAGLLLDEKVVRTPSLQGCLAQKKPTLQYDYT